MRLRCAPIPPQASSVRHAVSAAMKRRTSSKELKSGAGEMRTWREGGVSGARRAGVASPALLSVGSRERRGARRARCGIGVKG